ncbi:hypothetical protein DFJ74DRAFT_64881 [Hyaloraphidium curvatum]|nr:hypothetical protein DFJ74DRAFT_64881 [Hyaloraphidium curvatum]
MQYMRYPEKCRPRGPVVLERAEEVQPAANPTHTRQMNDDALGRAFHILKRHCVGILRGTAASGRGTDPSFEALLASEEQICKDFGSHVLASLSDYVIFPLVQVLRHPDVSDANAAAALTCLRRVLDAVAESDHAGLSGDNALELLTVLAVYVASGGFRRLSATGGPTLSVVPDELRLAAIQCLASLIAAEAKRPKRDPDAPFGNGSELIRKPLAHAVLGLVTAAEDVALGLDVRRSSLGVLKALVQLVCSSWTLLGRFLPGIVSSVSRLCLRDAKEHHSVIVAAAGIASTCLSAVLLLLRSQDSGDTTPRSLDDWIAHVGNWTDSNGTLLSISSGSDRPSDLSKSEMPSLAIASARMEKLAAVLLAQLCGHPHPYVKEAALGLAHVALSDGRTVRPALAAVGLESILVLGESEGGAGDAARRILERLQLSSDESWEAILKSTHERFLACFEALPSAVRQYSLGEARFESILFLKGCLRHAAKLWSLRTLRIEFAGRWLSDFEGVVTELLHGRSGKRVTRGIPATAGVSMFFSSLDYGGKGSITTNSSIAALDGESSGAGLEPALLLLGDLMKLVGGCIPSFQDEVADMVVHQLDHHDLSPGLVFIFRHVNDDARSPLQAAALRRVLRSALRRDADSSNAPESEGAIIGERDAALIADVIGICCQRMDLGDLELHLPDIVFVCLCSLGVRERAGPSSSDDVLRSLAARLGYPSPAELVVSLMDSVIDMFCSRLRRLFLLPRVPKALQSAIMLAGPSIAPLIEDTLDEVMDALDVWKRNEDVVTSLLGVLGDVCGALASAGPDEDRAEAKGDPEVFSADLPGLPREFPGGATMDMKAFWLKWGPGPNAADREAPSASLNDEVLDETGRCSGAGDDGAEQANGRPGKAKLLASVLEKCSHFASHGSPAVRRGLLVLFRTGFVALQKDNGELLPLLHRLWPVLVSRLSDSDRFVALEAVSAIATAVEVGKDFMTKRAREDLLPRMLSIWKSVFRTSDESNGDGRLLVTSKHAYNQRLMRSLVALTSALVQNVPLGVKEMMLVESGIAPLLDIIGASGDMAQESTLLWRTVASKDWEGSWLILQSWLGRSTVPEWLAAEFDWSQRSRIPRERKEQVADAILSGPPMT